MTRSSRAIVGLVAASLALFAASGGPSMPAQAQAPARVRLATLAPSALLWLHAIAQDQNLYAKHGVDVQVLQVADSSTLVQAVSTNSADAGIALGDNVMRAIDQGAPVVISGAILSRPILRLIGSVDRVQDLAGKRVTAGAVQGGTTNLLLYQLQRAGVTRGQVQLVALPNSRDRLVAMQGGQLQGALLIAPFDTLALQAGFKLLDVFRGSWLQTPLILNKNWAAHNPRAAAGITQALAAAAGWIYNPANRANAVRILAEYTRVEPAVAQESYEFIVLDQKAISRDLTVPRNSLESILRMQQLVEQRPMAVFDLSKYYDPRYLQMR